VAASKFNLAPKNN